MLSKSQIEEVGSLIEMREQQLRTALMAVPEYPKELGILDELSKVLKNAYNELADVDADNLGECYTWLTNKMPHEETNIAARLWWTLGNLMGKIEAGYVTEEDWEKLCLLRGLL